jgi:ubiquinone/menaquinone biosynthesis C-methylase UbiE
MIDGGYDTAYRACPCVWGYQPGSLIQELIDLVPSVSGWRVLDVGCGEGRNAAFLARRGAQVWASDISQAAISNALKLWHNQAGIQWTVGPVGDLPDRGDWFDLVIAYGLLHCLQSREQIVDTVARLQSETKPGGFNAVCTFNSRAQDLSAHPGFNPTLLPHDFFVGLYRPWQIISASDRDLHEIHPHNNVPHSHSMTRILARRPLEPLVGEDQ